MVSLFKKTLEKPLISAHAPPVSPTIADSYDRAFINRATKSFLMTAVIWLLIAGIILYWGGNMAVFGIVIGIVLLIFSLIQLQSGKFPRFGTKKQIQYILDTPIPSQLWHNDSLKSLNLPLKQRQQVEAGLKDFFILHALYPNKPLAMPSTLVDKLWHAFILDTKSYQYYCKKAFGKIFHHIPDYQFKDKNHNIQMFTWQSACRLQGLTPNNTSQMLRLFAIDPLLVTGIAVGGVMWLQHHELLQQQYQQWQAQNSRDGGGGADGGSSSGGNVGISDSGDCACGGGNGGCGGSSGCGGGGCGGGGD